MAENKKSLFKNVYWAMEPLYNHISEFHEGLAAFYSDGRWGYLDQAFNIAVNPQFDSALSFAEGLACVEVIDKWGFINRQGLMIIKPQFDEQPGNFSEGLAMFEVKDCETVIINKHEILSRITKYGFTDKEGNIVIKPQYRHAESFSEGLAAVSVNGKSGYINKKGEMVIEPVFEDALSFRNGKAQVCMGGKWGFIKNPLFL